MIEQYSIARNQHPRGQIRASKQYGGDGGIFRDDPPISASTAEEVISYEYLWEAMELCKRGVLWKDSVAAFWLDAPRRINKLSYQLRSHTYRSNRTYSFYVYSPKKREIVSITFRDRVYQRSLNDNVVYPLLTKSLIRDNTACQVGKGTDYARKRLEIFLHRMYNKHRLDFYILQIDISGYYPNMHHQIVDELICEKLPLWAVTRVRDILNVQYPGEIGYKPGSQLVQIIGISVLDKLDHYIKEKLHIKCYIRYMDDLILMHDDRHYLEFCKKMIATYLETLYFTFNPRKTKLFKINDQHLGFLGFNYHLTETGKVYKLVKSKNIKRAKRKYHRMIKLCSKGALTKDKVDECFYGYMRNHICKGSSKKLVRNLLDWYEEQWLIFSSQVLSNRQNDASSTT